MNAKDRTLLASVIAAMAVEATPFLMATEKSIAGLVKNGMVETNPEIRDGDKIATRASEKGIAAMNEADTNTTATGASAFEIEDGIEKRGRKGGRTSILYPFDALNVGQSFHIPATTEKPNPAKSIASTVSAATKKYATETGETKKSAKGNDIPVLAYTRRFSVEAVDANDPKGAGARVFRDA